MGCLEKDKVRVRFFPHLAALVVVRIGSNWYQLVASSDFQGSAERKTGICAVSNTF